MSVPSRAVTSAPLTWCLAATLAVVAVTATPAGAHIRPEPDTAPAGARATIGLTVEHGCEGSPTLALAVRVPGGSVDPQPEPQAGWTGSVDGDVVNFTGGPLPDDIEATFSVTVTLPLAPGATVYFPMVQTREVGVLRWIDVPGDGSGDDSDSPAPALLLTDPEPGTTTSTIAPAPTVPPSTLPSPTTAAPTTAAPTSFAAPSATDPVDPVPPPVAPGTTVVAESGGSDGDAGALVALGVGIAAVVIAAAWLVMRRRR
jgi:periplasmic copper chaperone A